jgi:hypothetical protein
MDSAEILRYARMLDGIYIYKFCFDYGGDFSVLGIENRQCRYSGSQTNYTAHLNTGFHRDIGKCWVI